MINYHIHTPLCNHAKGTMTEYIHQAVAMGLTEICFLDHLTLNPADKGLSMMPEEVPLYYHAVRQLARHYKDSLRIKVGLEVDFHPDYIAPVYKIIDTFDFDVIGGSVHYIEDKNIVSRQSGWGRGERNTDSVYTQYYELMDQMLDQNYFDFIGHFDLPKKFCRFPEQSFKKIIEGLLTKVKNKGLALEINTSGFGHPIGEMYPSPEIIKTCHHYGIPLTLGSDAHRPDQLNRYYRRTLARIRDIGYRHLRTYTRREPKKFFINGEI